MLLPKATIEEFISIYREEYGSEISYEEASESAPFEKRLRAMISCDPHGYNCAARSFTRLSAAMAVEPNNRLAPGKAGHGSRGSDWRGRHAEGASSRFRHECLSDQSPSAPRPKVAGACVASDDGDLR